MKCIIALNSVHIIIIAQISKYRLLVWPFHISSRYWQKNKGQIYLTTLWDESTPPVISLIAIKRNDCQFLYILCAALSLTNYSARQQFDNFICNSRRKGKMARVSAIVSLQLSVLLLVLSASTDGLPLEDRFEQLTQDFVRNSLFYIFLLSLRETYVKS